jgi:hypothetical protein
MSLKLKNNTVQEHVGSAAIRQEVVHLQSTSQRQNTGARQLAVNENSDGRSTLGTNCGNFRIHFHVYRYKC